ncbi:MAG: CapA family protein [Clostridia bacterium]|nr:CapA family protein [Clostridia bacterium]
MIKIKNLAAVILVSALLVLPGCRDAAPVQTDTTDSGSEWQSGESVRSASTQPVSGKLIPDTIIETSDRVEPVDGVLLHVIACGDNLIHPNIYMDAAIRGTAEKEYDFLPMYEYIRPYISEADIAFINQETVMAGAEYGYSGYPCFNCPQQLGLDLVEIGYDVINMANNHELDKGESGYRSTLDFWHEQPVTLLGGHYDQNDFDDIRVTEYDGLRIAWLSYTYGTNGITLPYGSEMVVPYIDEERIVSDMQRAKQIADMTIVSMHWGIEYTYDPIPDQRHLAQVIADNGAAVILGHHSHCLEPVEWIEGKDGNRTLCIFSLGNFACGQASPMTLVGGMLSFDISLVGGKYEITSPLLTPTVIYYDWNWYNTRVYPLDMYSSDIAATHGLGNPSIYGQALTYDTAKNIVLGCIDPEFLPDYLK